MRLRRSASCAALRRCGARAHSTAAAAAPTAPPAAAAGPLTTDENLALRKRFLAPSQKMHYDGSEAGPLHLTRGRGAYLYDTDGAAHLDCVNNVAHVGHCHPRVVAAATRQLETLNTNSRYVHDNIARLAAALTATLPAPLDTVFFVNSGTEANDLAIRLARKRTGRQQMVCVDGAYHGHSVATLAVSPYSKYAEAEASGGTAVLSQPDVYRLGLSDEQATSAAAAQYAEVLRAGPAPAAFLVESVMCCGGQVQLPRGYLGRMYEQTRAGGGLAIADEVQTGFGRSGSSFWAFESHGVVPDIVTMGKPMGNGFPLAAVVTTGEVADAFRSSEYFNTFGGNTVACAVGLEVLAILEEERLQESACRVGAHTLSRLREVGDSRGAVGDVRGRGLLLGVELVRDRGTREPDPELAAFAMGRMRAERVLVSTDGPHRNVLKIKPPMCFSDEDADALASALDSALAAGERELPAGRTGVLPPRPALLSYL